MIHEDCKYWHASCELCGITGNETCKCKCKDYNKARPTKVKRIAQREKTMETWEMIKILYENPKLKAKGRGYNSPVVINKYGHVTWRDCDELVELTQDFMSTEWTVIPPKPDAVPFMDAVKAYVEGKTIRCESDFANTTVYVPAAISHFVDQHSLSVSPDEILAGKWYIEE